MASRYFGVNKGGSKIDVAEGSSTNTKAVELVVNLASGLDRQEVLLAVESIIQKIQEDSWPPA